MLVEGGPEASRSRAQCRSRYHAPANCPLLHSACAARPGRGRPLRPGQQLDLAELLLTMSSEKTYQLQCVLGPG